MPIVVLVLTMLENALVEYPTATSQVNSFALLGRCVLNSSGPAVWHPGFRDDSSRTRQ